MTSDLMIACHNY